MSTFAFNLGTIAGRLHKLAIAPKKNVGMFSGFFKGLDELPREIAEGTVGAINRSVRRVPALFRDIDAVPDVIYRNIRDTLDPKRRALLQRLRDSDREYKAKLIPGSRQYREEAAKMESRMRDGIALAPDRAAQLSFLTAAAGGPRSAITHLGSTVASDVFRDLLQQAIHGDRPPGPSNPNFRSRFEKEKLEVKEPYKRVD